MLYFYKNELKTPKPIDLEWINNFIYANVSNFVLYMFGEKIGKDGKFHNPISGKDHAVYFQKGKKAIVKNGEDYSGKIIVFDGSSSAGYSNFFNLLVGFIDAKKRKGNFESERLVCKNRESVRTALDKIKNWLRTFDDEYIDSEQENEVISEKEILGEDLSVNCSSLNEFYKKHYAYEHGKFEENFENAYFGFKFKDFGCDSWLEFKQKYLILASDGYVKNDKTGKIRYTKQECEKFGIYCLKWFRDMSILNRIKAANSVLYFLLLNYYIFEIKDNLGRLVAVRWRYRFDKKKKEELEKGGKGRKVEKYQNMIGYKQKFILNNLENFMEQDEDSNLILIESWSDIPSCYRKFGDYGNHFVATGTAGLTLEQINILKYVKSKKPNLKLFVAFDNDVTGINKNEKFVKKFTELGFETDVIKFDGKDWEDNDILNLEQLTKIIEGDDLPW